MKKKRQKAKGLFCGLSCVAPRLFFRLGRLKKKEESLSLSLPFLTSFIFDKRARYVPLSATTKKNVDEERIVRDGVHFVFDDVFFFGGDDEKVVLVVGKKRIRRDEKERPQQQRKGKKQRGGLLGEGEEELSTPRRGLFSKRRARTRERDVVIARR